MKLLITLLMGFFFVGSALASEDAPASAGKKIFTEKKCNGCHSIEAEGIVKKTAATKTGPPDLSAVGASAKPGFIAKYLMKEADVKGKKHMMKFAGTPEELKTLAEYLEGLKGKAEEKK
jgi:mono/diheme cytochrome c family protein